MKRILKLLYSFVFTAILTLINIEVAIANNTKEYTITRYNIDIIVNENNTLDITENITANFHVPKHGIYRKIPLKNKVERLNGTTSYNRAKITNIEVNDNKKIYNENGYKVIKIGDENSTLTGQKKYLISYTYNLGKDTGKGYDELYFNLIGDEWDTSIDNITFTIRMPKEFDKTKLGFSHGRYGTVNSSNLTYQVTGNTITGNLNKTLNSYEALTIRLELPEGYFKGKDPFELHKLLAVIIPILFVCLGYQLWKKHGNDDKVIETVEFYPPENLNSLDLGCMYKGYTSETDVISLLIYLANKGYLRISEYNSTSLFINESSFQLTKLKDYDGNSAEERIFFNSLFSHGFTNQVTSDDLINNFYKTINALKRLSNKKNEHIIYEKISLSKTKNILLMIAITIGLIIIPPLITLSIESFKRILVYALFTGVGIIFSMKTTVNILRNWKQQLSKVVSVLKGLCVILLGWCFTGYLLKEILFPLLIMDNSYLYIFILGILCILLLVIIWEYMPRRTIYGNKILGKIIGFKNFLETVEKDQLEALVNKNPTYFYDILPYTYVLGVSDKWIKKFETINYQSPHWYDGTLYDNSSFGKFINRTMKSAQRFMTSTPSSSSSSGGGSSSSGGGFSGGGSGGGGGGSW